MNKTKAAGAVGSSALLGVTSFDLNDDRHIRMCYEIASAVLDDPCKEFEPTFSSLLTLTFGDFVIRVNKKPTESVSIRSPNDVSTIRRVVEFVTACHAKLNKHICNFFVVIRCWGVRIHNRVRATPNNQAQRPTGGDEHNTK